MCNFESFGTVDCIGPPPEFSEGLVQDLLHLEVSLEVAQALASGVNRAPGGALACLEQIEALASLMADRTAVMRATADARAATCQACRLARPPARNPAPHPI